MTPEQTAKNLRVAELAGYRLQERGFMQVWIRDGKMVDYAPSNFCEALSAIWQEVQRMTRDQIVLFQNALDNLSDSEICNICELTAEDWCGCYITVMEQKPSTPETR